MTTHRTARLLGYALQSVVLGTLLAAALFLLTSLMETTTIFRYEGF